MKPFARLNNLPVSVLTEPRNSSAFQASEGSGEARESTTSLTPVILGCRRASRRVSATRTLAAGNIYQRMHTYKSRQRAERAFYKWVCKREYYGELIFARPSPHHRHRWMRLPPPGRTWVNGVPPFSPIHRFGNRTPRWEWDREFDKHYDALALQQEEERREQLLCRMSISEEQYRLWSEKAKKLIGHERSATTLMRGSELEIDDIPLELLELQTLITAAKRLLRNKT